MDKEAQDAHRNFHRHGTIKLCSVMNETGAQLAYLIFSTKLKCIYDLPELIYIFVWLNLLHCSFINRGINDWLRIYWCANDRRKKAIIAQNVHCRHKESEVLHLDVLHTRSQGVWSSLLDEYARKRYKFDDAWRVSNMLSWEPEKKIKKETLDWDLNTNSSMKK